MTYIKIITVYIVVLTNNNYLYFFAFAFLFVFRLNNNITILKTVKYFKYILSTLLPNFKFFYNSDLF